MPGRQLMEGLHSILNHAASGRHGAASAGSKRSARPRAPVEQPGPGHQPHAGCHQILLHPRPNGTPRLLRSPAAALLHLTSWHARGKQHRREQRNRTRARRRLTLPLTSQLLFLPWTFEVHATVCSLLHRWKEYGAPACISICREQHHREAHEQ